MARKFRLNGEESGEWIQISEQAAKAVSENAWEQPMRDALVEYLQDSEVTRE